MQRGKYYVLFPSASHVVTTVVYIQLTHYPTYVSLHSQICAKMCKAPTQRFFAEQWGVPLTMSPNFETGECQLVFGEEPIPIEEDPTIPPGCLTRCPAATLMERHPTDTC